MIGWGGRLFRSGLAGKVDDYGLAGDSRGVVDPGLNFGFVLAGGAAAQVHRIGDAVRSDNPATRAGEGVRTLYPAVAVRAGEPEALGVLTWIGVMDIKIDQYSLPVCPGARNPGHGQGR